jgi:hypothetical protein
LALVVLTSIAAGCAGQTAAPATYARLKGAWYQSATGLKYDFASPTLLVLPSMQPNGGNTIKYEILAGNKIALTQNGATKVEVIERLDEQVLVTRDPANGKAETYFRDLGKTAFAQTRAKIAAGALTALKRFPTIGPRSKIVWTTAPPSGSVSPWPSWPTSSIARYRTAWDWSTVKRSSSDVKVSGSGVNAGYAVVFERSVPTAKDLATYSARTGLIADPGGPLIEVGYSAATAKYPAGTFVYVRGGLIYSLGDGYALGVLIGPTEARAFAPYTYHR